MLVDIQFPPGLLKNGTEYGSKGRWRDGNQIRFSKGVPQPIGSWSWVDMNILVNGVDGGAIEYTDGSVRNTLAWQTNAGERYVAMGTNTKLYVTNGSVLKDVSPTAVSLSTGQAKTQFGAGFGADNFGAQDFGDARTLPSVYTELASWHYDTWGENLLCSLSSDGRLFEWDPSTNAAVLIAASAGTVPTEIVSFLTTNERIVMVCGYADNPLGIKWSDQEDNTDWLPTTTNASGDLTLESEGQIITCIKWSDHYLVFTEVDVWRIDYLGPPFYYGVTKVASDCGVAGPHSVSQNSKGVVWMSRNGFFLYNGSTVDRLDSDVDDFVLGDIDWLQRRMVSASFNRDFNEFWWFYMSTDNANRGNNDDCDSYVFWDYKQNYWTTGIMQRSAMTSTGIFERPLAFYSFDGDDTLLYPAGHHSRVYQHETGYDAPFTDAVNVSWSPGRDVFLESGPIETGLGDVNTEINRIYQDTGLNLSSVSVTFKGRRAPHATEFSSSAYLLDETRGYTDVRFNGRQIKIRFDQVADQFWQLGINRLDLQGGTGR